MDLAVRPPEENAAIREIKKQVGDLAEDINRTRVLRDHVFEELKKLADASEDAKEDADKMRKNYSGRLSRKDDRIRELQDQLDLQMGEAAELRAENERLKSQIGTLEKRSEKEDRMEKELQKLKDEKERQAEEIRRLTEEKDSLSVRSSHFFDSVQ